MNQEYPERQLSRRELRERALLQQETAAVPEVNLVETAAIDVAAAQGELTAQQLEIMQQLEAQVVVPAFDDNGDPLDRRAQRKARRQAYEELLLQWEAEHGSLTEYGTQEPEPEADPVSNDVQASAESADSIVSELFEQQSVADQSSETQPDESVAVAAEPENVAVVIEESAAVDLESGSAAEEKEYSFPDIVPLDEDRSIFDDPHARKVSANSAELGFDALLNRAVQEESAGSVSGGTAALILPSIPQDSAQYDALDAEKGIYVSGSLQLHPSISETGGHSSLQSAWQDDNSGVDDDSIYKTGNNTQPIAALRAVSLQQKEGAALLNEVKKDRQKAPLVFAISGGVLIITAAGIVIAAVNGVFG